MKNMRSAEITASSSELERLRSISNFSNAISEIVASPSSSREKEEQMRKLLTTFKSHFGGIESTVN